MEPISRPSRRPPWWSRRRVVLPIFALLALVGGWLPAFSWAATQLIVAVGAALTGLSLVASGPAAGRTATVRRDAGGRDAGGRDAGGRDARLRGRPRPRVGWWSLPLLVFVPIEVANFLLGSGHPHPTVSVLLDPLLAVEPVRSVAYFGWLVGFWWLALAVHPAPGPARSAGEPTQSSPGGPARSTTAGSSSAAGSARSSAGGGPGSPAGGGEPG